ncbi:MAG: guanylate kinase [Clostridiales bacterium]|nr:guanylate kinase [Clostridiales bacterium]
MSENKRKGLLIVLSAPSGCGKDTVLASLDGKIDNFRRSVSMTTRKKRDGETDGLDYYFVTPEYFLERLSRGQILEHTNYNGNYYGTPKTTVDEWLKNGDTVILKIEVEGAKNIRSLYPDSVSIFLVPPSMSSLEKRLRKRNSDSDEEIQSRLTIAQNEMKNAVNYDYIVVNDKLETAVEDICAIINAERHRTSRSKNIISEVISNA